MTVQNKTRWYGRYRAMSKAKRNNEVVVPLLLKRYGTTNKARYWYSTDNHGIKYEIDKIKFSTLNNQILNLSHSQANTN